MTTPMMQQYREAKARHPGMMLFFRNGDFYELFEEDAELGARLLGITLTRRDKSIPMAGVPHHALERYLGKLLQLGHRVAICEQMEDASQAKGIIRREVNRVVTPGTVTEDGLLDPRRSNHLASVYHVPGRHPMVGLAWVELSTGQFQAADVPTARLMDELGRLTPSECLYPENLAGDLTASLRETFPEMTLSSRPDWNFDSATARASLHNHFKVTTLTGFGFDDHQPCLIAAGALLQYLDETLRATLPHLIRLRPYRQEHCLFLDEVTRRSLELTRTLRDNDRQGSLVWALDRAVTAMGARLLQEWLSSPLGERAEIERRLDAVEEFVRDPTLRQDVRELLRDVLDLQRLTARVGTNRASPRDLASIARTLRLLPRFKAQLSARQSALLRHLESRLELCADLREVLDAALTDDPPVNPREGNVIRQGYDAELDSLRALSTNGKNWVASYQAKEITRTGINSLKVGYNQVAGYYIEVTHAHAAKIPSNYRRVGTLKNAERYVTPELQEYAERIEKAEGQIEQREHDLFLAVRERVAAQTARLLSTAEVLATLDILAGLAELAVSRGYCRPKLVDEPILRLSEARHPVLDQVLPPGTFVPNDARLGGEDGTFLLITGPNMAGKSVYLRQTALLTIMAQVGSFVPARDATIGLADRIFSRVGASDEMRRAQSTFMVEMTEAANILNNATPRSLVILDELGRGTSTFDGVSLAWAITEHLHDRIGCRALFATHYHELAELEEKLPRLRNFNVLVHEGPQGIVFLHRIARGSATKSYGIHVAELAGIPREVLERAREVLAELEKHHLAQPDRATQGRGPRRPKVIQGSLFANTDDPILQALREADLEKMPPEQALEQLRRWQRELRR